MKHLWGNIFTDIKHMKLEDFHVYMIILRKVEQMTQVLIKSISKHVFYISRPDVFYYSMMPI
jgi:hypothetical protein